MPIGSSTKDLLHECARVMVSNNEDREIDLLEIDSALYACRDEIIAYLTREVTIMTRSAKTLREIDRNLLEFRCFDQGTINLVVCRPDTPTGTVTELTRDMVPWSLVGRSHGLFSPQRADESLVFERRQTAAKNSRRSTYTINGEHDANLLMTACYDNLIRRAMDSACDSVVSSDALHFLEPGSYISFSKIAATCRALDITIYDLLGEIIDLNGD